MVLSLKTNGKQQCWALVPLLASQRHWRELKNVAHVAVAPNYNGTNLRHFRAISAPFSNRILLKNFNKLLLL